MKHFLGVMVALVIDWSPLEAQVTPLLPTSHTRRDIEGWTVHIDDRLLSGADKELGDHALRILANRLYDIQHVVPADKVARLRQVPIWIDKTHGKLRPAQYHPSAGWLKANGYSPALAKCVHIPVAAAFASVDHQRVQPWSVLHELAHAYHDQVLGFDHTEIHAAWARFRDSGKYQTVLHINGNKTKHYGLTNPMEFFAEMTESYFGHNDFFPFNRAELQHEEPEVFALLTTIWGPIRKAERLRPVKVFVLAGQSNMEGHGMIGADPKRNQGKGSLEYLVKNPATAVRFKHLVDKHGKWIIRDDVWISYLDRKGPLTVGYGASKDLIGPELGFGWVMGDALKEPVLLIKCAWGGKSLAVDFRPPSSGKMPYSLGEKMDAAIKQDPAIVGKYYRETLTLTKAALDKVKELVPRSDGRYELTGFGWHQGWNDRINDKYNAEYETNLANFIRDIRRDLGAPRLPFVIAETGMNGPEETHPRALSLMKAQAAVAARAEFKGNVAFVGTKEFWRPQVESPSGQGYHWNANAETYYLIGEAMGEAMKKLMSEK